MFRAKPLEEEMRDSSMPRWLDGTWKVKLDWDTHVSASLVTSGKSCLMNVLSCSEPTNLRMCGFSLIILIFPFPIRWGNHKQTSLRFDPKSWKGSSDTSSKHTQRSKYCQIQPLQGQHVGTHQGYGQRCWLSKVEVVFGQIIIVRMLLSRHKALVEGSGYTM